MVSFKPFRRSFSASSQRHLAGGIEGNGSHASDPLPGEIHLEFLAWNTFRRIPFELAGKPITKYSYMEGHIETEGRVLAVLAGTMFRN